MSPEKDQKVRTLRVDTGYVYHGHVNRNDWFVLPDFNPSAHDYPNYPVSLVELPNVGHR
jgi:hypothetical protein